MVRMNAGDDDTGGRSRRSRWLLGIAATGVGVSGVFLFLSQAVGTHITACGFDANGAYAQVRVNHLLGFAPQKQEVWVDFYLDGKQFAYGGRYDVPVPAFGHGRALVRASFPRTDVLHVSGRTVYVDATHRRQVKFVTREFAQAHPARILTEVVPGPGHTLSCGMDYTDPD